MSWPLIAPALWQEPGLVLQDNSTDQQGAAAPDGLRQRADGLVGLSNMIGRRAWLRRPAAWALRWVDVSLRIFVIAFLFAVVIGVIDPFGLKRAGEVQSQRIAGRMFAPFYGMPPTSAGSPAASAQDHIAVVLIDDHTLQARESAWPPRYSYYDEVLRRVLAQQPRAVYVDILMEQRRDYDDSYTDARDGIAAEIGCAKVPVLFGVSAPGRRSIFSGVGSAASGCSTALPASNSDIVPVAQDVVTSWKGVGSDYPLLLAAKNVRDEGWVPSLSTGPGFGADYRSVALALYQQACRTRSDAGCRESARALNAQALGTPMSVQWGSTLPRLPVQPHGLGCVRTAPVGWWSRLASAAGLTVDGFLSGLDEQVENHRRERCAYTLTVFEEQLDDPALAAVLKDRVVLIGTRLNGLGDQVISPVHQQLPGVYLHAMALDNLMQWGSERMYTDSLRDRLSELLGMLLICFTAGAALLLTPRISPRWLRWLRSAVVVVACIGSSLLIVLVSQLYLRQPPGHWLSALVLACVAIWEVSWWNVREQPSARPAEIPETIHE
ncbi:CHASE2 domain-containing protein [Xanthomonas cucurbitae]|uniref:CHASE2 domain-containing protein n=1 Tax=Xanthomonas cucurbitae TaxID=56453 RepID=A0ABY7YFH4_9XANT|nr:CHASE2 domain-containing protein [Xanthomonas cucurbitae]WDM68642.1 CHASE2 domain-containing protein [Xanthomonas cucurbitae]WDM72516.1 CHASE2 domain-containing protein [Xanthomonas cucurbitae]